ncbi:hypothetical protein B0A55_09836 [Friedmanniomyces simplex]|uniref:Protein kinase domain-containing protein n=1 Tax=Friedmanniomyces simplex TaxID=329884 RepID=A0A4U0X2A1_9PEZI|nr:hypothetical protein B0A55_09836 [Friedmanniomyces simplex]
MSATTFTNNDNLGAASSKETTSQSNYLFQQLGEGYHATVYLSIAKQTADRILTDHAAGPASRDNRAKTLAKLRENTQALKICRDRLVRGEQMNTIHNEASILGALSKHPHPNVVRLIEADDAGSKKVWYTMPLSSTSTLQQVLNTPWTTGTYKPPAAFGWHICLQMAKAFLYLHHGVLEDGTTVPDWPLVAHRDPVDRNSLFMPWTKDAGGDKCEYPTLIIADFDRAQQLLPAGHPQAGRYEILQAQRKDLDALSFTAECVARRIDEEALMRWSTALANVSQPEAGAIRNEHAFNMLNRFVKAAEKRRETLYQPLPSEFRALFGRSEVTDEELETAFPILK